LYCKAEKCEFSVKKVGFLGFVISPDGIEMEADRIATIEDWPTPKSVKDVQVLMGFTNFYRRFVKKYAKVTAPITNLLKKSEKWEWTREADAAFQKLKCAFTEAPILQHFVTGRMDTGRAVRNREYQLDETRLDKEQIVNLSITYCKTIVK
jgi:hypothetical protein